MTNVIHRYMLWFPTINDTGWLTNSKLTLWILVSSEFGALSSVFVSISPFPCLAWSQLQQPTPLCALTPSFMPLPLGVAAIVVSNKVYGITDLWNWIFSLHQSSGITALRPVASGHNWPATELFFPRLRSKGGKIRRLQRSQTGSFVHGPGKCISLQTGIFSAAVYVSLESTTFTNSYSACPCRFHSLILH